MHLKRLLPLIVLMFGSIGWAQDGRIHRCIGENGEPTFSDRKCERAGIPAAQGAPASAAAAMPNPYAPSSGPLPRAPVVTQTCPVSPEDLRDRVAAAFEAKNGVGLSGLFLWDGFGYGTAVAPLRDLARLIAEPLISIEIESYAGYDERDRHYRRDRRDYPELTLELVIRTVAEQERQVPYEAISRFQMTENMRCWWLQLPW